MKDEKAGESRQQDGQAGESRQQDGQAGEGRAGHAGSTRPKRRRRKSRKAAVVEGMLKIDGVDFVLVGADEFLRLGGDEGRLTGLPPRKARENAVATRVREARKHVGLTQAQLAMRLGKSQTFVSHAESGSARVNERYVGAVLKACGLRRTWGLARGAQDAALASDEIAGLDPETCEVVMRGTKRDRELGQKYAWWNNRCSLG